LAAEPHYAAAKYYSAATGAESHCESYEIACFAFETDSSEESCFALTKIPLQPNVFLLSLHIYICTPLNVTFEQHHTIHGKEMHKIGRSAGRSWPDSRGNIGESMRAVLHCSRG